MGVPVEVLTARQIARLLLDQGVNGWAAVNGVATALAESGGNRYALNVVQTPGASRHSLDVGLWQINTRWHPRFFTLEPFGSVSMVRAFDPVEATAFAVSLARPSVARPWLWLWRDLWSVWQPDASGVAPVARFLSPAVVAVRAEGGSV